MLRRIVVLASGSEVASPEEFAAAHRVGRLFAERSLIAVTGGDAFGPAGTVADVLLGAGGRVVGVTIGDEGSDRVHPGLTERRVVAGTREREQELALIADGVLVLPGALGSLEAVIGIWGWGASGNGMPVGLLDEGGYYSALLGTAGDAALDRYVAESQRGLLILSRDLDDLITRMAEYRPPETRRAFADPA